MERVEGGFLNYELILDTRTSFNYEPNDDIYIHQVKIFIHIHMYVYVTYTYVCICNNNAIFSYKENMFERKTYSVKSSFLLVPHMSCAYDWILCIT
jgi:hypothetical protein